MRQILLRYLTEEVITFIKIGILALAIVFLFIQFFSRKGSPVKKPSLSKGNFKSTILITLAVISLAAFLNFGLLHRTNFIHWWEIFHYYIGTKYFKEVGYFNLYNATVVADSEENTYLEKSDYIMDLSNYYLIPRDKILAKSIQYKTKFSPQRWQSFKNDIAFLKRNLWPGRFQRMMNDHGYHATPIWNTTAGFLVNRVPLNRVLFLCLIDPILLIIMFIALYLSFGMIPALLMLIYFCLDFLSGFYWMGGCFLRQDWLVVTMLGLCMLKQNRYGLAGSLFSYATMSRIFPVLFIGGITVKAITDLIIHRKIPHKYFNFLLAFLLTTVILFGYGCLGGKGIEKWRGFIQKIKIHNDNLLTNNLGLRHIFLHDGRETDFPTFVANYGGHYHDGDLQDYFIYWTKAKQQEFKDRWLSFLVYSVLALLMFGYIANKEDDVGATAWGAFLIFMLLSISCYFYSFLIVLVLLFSRDCDKNLDSTISLSLLFLLQIFSHLLFWNKFFLDRYLKISLMLAVYFFYLILYYLFREILQNKSGRITYK